MRKVCRLSRVSEKQRERKRLMNENYKREKTKREFNELCEIDDQLEMIVKKHCC